MQCLEWRLAFVFLQLFYFPGFNFGRTLQVVNQSKFMFFIKSHFGFYIITGVTDKCD